MNELLNSAKKLFNSRISRSKFLKLLAYTAAILPFYKYFIPDAASKTTSFNGRTKKPVRTEYDLVAARGDDPYKLTYTAIEKLGGMGRFVKRGDVVVVKPNIAWDRNVEQAANTNPLVVSALVKMCYDEGAKTVKVFDIPCNEARRSYSNSGIEKAARDAGARVFFANDWDVIEAQYENKASMSGWPILRDAVECDCFINVPILKHHGLTRLTLSIKNLMGVCAGSRGRMHWNISEKLVDLTNFINPDLNVVDAYRILVRNGPSGGSLADVELKKTVFASADAVLADVYACKVAGVMPEEVSYIKEAMNRKMGISDLKQADILEVS